MYLFVLTWNQNICIYPRKKLQRRNVYGEAATRRNSGKSARKSKINKKILCSKLTIETLEEGVKYVQS